MFGLIKKEKRDISGELIKEQALKSKGVLLDIMSESIEKGNRLCPRLLGHACLGKACMFFMEFKNIDKDGNEIRKFWNCADVQQPLIQIEIARNIRDLGHKIDELVLMLKK